MGLLKFLLDTHCWIWLRGDWSRFPSPVRRRILRDPTNRLLVAQAQVEGLTLVSADPNVLAYDVAAIDARK